MRMIETKAGKRVAGKGRRRRENWLCSQERSVE